MRVRPIDRTIILQRDRPLYEIAADRKRKEEKREVISQGTLKRHYHKQNQRDEGDHYARKTRDRDFVVLFCKADNIKSNSAEIVVSPANDDNSYARPWPACRVH